MVCTLKIESFVLPFFSCLLEKDMETNAGAEYLSNHNQRYHGNIMTYDMRPPDTKEVTKSGSLLTSN